MHTVYIYTHTGDTLKGMGFDTARHGISLSLRSGVKSFISIALSTCHVGLQSHQRHIHHNVARCWPLLAPPLIPSVAYSYLANQVETLNTIGFGPDPR